MNICSTSRSGSTLLDVMLGSAPRAFSCGEVCALFRPSRRHHFEINCPCGRTPCPVWTRLQRYPPRRFHAGACAELDLDLIVDSSKDHAWVVDNNVWAARSGLRVVNILLWREPIALAYSAWKRDQLIDSWQDRFVAYYRRARRTGIPFFTLRLDDLLTSPAAQLADLGRRLAIPGAEGQERFWEHDHHHLFGAAGVRAAVVRRAGAIETRPGYPEPFVRAFRESQDPLPARVRAELDHLRRSTGAMGSLVSGWRVPPRMSLWYHGRRLRRLRNRIRPEFALKRTRATDQPR